MEGNRRLFYYFYSTRRKKESVERSRENSTEGRSSHFSQDSNSSSNSSSPRSHRYCISRFLDCLRLYRDRDNYGLSGWIRFCLGRARRCVIMERLQISRPLRDQLYTGCWSGSQPVRGRVFSRHHDGHAQYTRVFSFFLYFFFFFVSSPRMIQKRECSFTKGRGDGN